MSERAPSPLSRETADAMASILEVASIPWFAVYMGLHNDGLVPTVTPRELLPSKKEVLEFWGPKKSNGISFDNKGNEEYEIYIRDLYTRVLQLNWPVSGIIPLHFARGVVAEAKGVEINWAVFAFKQTHPHQSNSRIPRVLPQFSTITTPLKPLVKILPFSEAEVS